MSEPHRNDPTDPQRDELPEFKGWKERLYDRFPFSLRTMDIIIGVLITLIVIFILLGMLKTRLG